MHKNDQVRTSEKYLFRENSTSSARARVLGDGPNRSQLPLYYELCEFPLDAAKELLEYAAKQNAKNDLFSLDRQKIAYHCPLQQRTPEGYQHLLLTVCDANSNSLDEKNYTVWTEEAKELRVYHWFQKFFPSAFRVRMAVLPPKSEFSWHIDTNTSVACRCSVSLHQHDSRFEIKKREVTTQVPLDPGKVFFTNTAYSHRVYNMDEKPRINLVFGIRYEGLEAYFRE